MDTTDCPSHIPVLTSSEAHHPERRNNRWRVIKSKHLLYQGVRLIGDMRVCSEANEIVVKIYDETLF